MPENPEVNYAGHPNTVDITRRIPNERLVSKNALPKNEVKNCTIIILFAKETAIILA